MTLIEKRPAAVAGLECELAEAVAEAERQRRRAEVLLAQCERLRGNLEISWRLRDELDAVRSSTLWRATQPLRALVDAIPMPVRRNAIRAAKACWWAATLQLQARWREWQALRQRYALPPHDTTSEPDTAPMALVIDYRWPQPDRDSGSLDTMNLVAALLELGFRITFSANSDYPRAEIDKAELARYGVRCIPSGPPLDAFFRDEGRTVELCVLSRIFGGGAQLESVNTFCPTSRIVFNTVDLHFIRAEREALLRGDMEALAFSRQVRAREEFIAANVDATIVVSSHESRVLKTAVPSAFVVHLPLGRRLRPPATSFSARHGIGFIAGFAHAPNLDALQFFLAEIWPLICREMPDCEFLIVGADLPPDVLRDVPGRVRYLGHLPEVDGWFESVRLTVAPLRFGAGAKGKIASSLAAGVPCVATAVGIEGMGLEHGANILCADDPAEFAAAVCGAYNNQLLWERLARGAQAYAADELSLTGWKTRLREMLWTIGAIGDARAELPAGLRAGSGSAQQDCLHAVDHPLHGEIAGEVPTGSRYARA